ncbi:MULTISPECIES: MarR family winged helix-turn-helix transcriptional regulator [Paenibacillus]|uniref:MarR family winged helix-turn-helix transcriptional regulator n=1 Tax=Paenibacillus TaxID=44249 RepID=UPI0020405523|nr:MarR family transcriptional regulator [Paenibacillus camelliae]MCM3633852.1 MarR family transcriptional regulator [Paenibacillus camelliae]
MDDFLTLDKQLCFAIYETSSQFSKLYSTVLADFELTYPQYLVLLALWEKDGIGVTAIGEKINLGTGTLTPILSRMEKSGWLRKERSKEDERKVLVHLEAKAYEQKQSITKAVQERIINCNISIDEYVQLMTQLQQLQKKLEQAKQ